MYSLIYPSGGQTLPHCFVCDWLRGRRRGALNGEIMTHCVILLANTLSSRGCCASGGGGGGGGDRHVCLSVSDFSLSRTSRKTGEMVNQSSITAVIQILPELSCVGIHPLWEESLAQQLQKNEVALRRGFISYDSSVSSTPQTHTPVCSAQFLSGLTASGAFLS